MASISNVEVFGLDSSIYRSGYPMMQRAPSEQDFRESTKQIYSCLLAGDYNNLHIKRAIKLANTRGGGHDQFLTGIVVNFDLTLSNKAWVEAERYTFLNFISSMSTMHRAAMLKISDCCNEYVRPELVRAAEGIRRHITPSTEAKTQRGRRPPISTCSITCPPGLSSWPA